jgi:hypothetical protein
MNALDLKGPSPRPKSLEEAQQVIDALWRALGEALERIEQLEEQRRMDPGNSSKAPSSDSPRSRAQRRRGPARLGHRVPNQTMRNTNGHESQSPRSMLSSGSFRRIAISVEGG